MIKYISRYIHVYQMCSEINKCKIDIYTQIQFFNYLYQERFKLEKNFRYTIYSCNGATRRCT